MAMITEPAKVSRQRNPSCDTTLDIEQAPAAVPHADLHGIELAEPLGAEPWWKPTRRSAALAFLALLGLGLVVLVAGNFASLQDENTALRADIAELRSEHDAVHEAVHASLAANRDNIDDHAGIVRAHAERISAHTDDISTVRTAVHTGTNRAAMEESAGDIATNSQNIEAEAQRTTAAEVQLREHAGGIGPRILQLAVEMLWRARAASPPTDGST